VVIPNGIELPSLPISEELRPQLLDSLMPARSPFILFIGRLSSQKNVLELLRKSDAMLSQLPQHHLVLVGDGPLRQSAFQVIQQLQHSGRVHMVGWQPNATAWLANSELLVLPSLYEGMPNAVLEAMAYQKPVVCFEVEGTRELLGDDSNEPLASKRRIATDEQLVELGNWQQMEHQIVRLCTDQSLANNLATANRSRVQKHFQLRDQLNKYQQLYKAAIQTASNTHGT
jgi:starch synthase (maltosyl-transferring)